MELFTILKRFPLFKKLSEEELENISSKITETTYADGEIIARRGGAGDSLYLIKDGTVEITIPLYRYEQQCPVVSKLSKGMFFGEISFFDGKEHSADVQAKGEVKLMILRKKDFDDIITLDPESGYNIQNRIILNLINTIREMNNKYSFNAFLR